MLSSSFVSGQLNISLLPLGDSFQLTVFVVPSNSADVEPIKETDSNFSENLSIASTPHAFATVVSQCPCFCLPITPLVILGISSFQFSNVRRVSKPLTAFSSVETISHQRSSVLSVEKPIVVPWRLSRDLIICSDSFSFLSRSGISLILKSTFIQSITADVGHKLGSIDIEPRRFGSLSPLRERASNAAIFLIERSAVGKDEYFITLPSMNPFNPVTMRIFTSEGISYFASLEIERIEEVSTY